MGKNLGKQQILIVEDDYEIREALSEVLRFEEYEVFTAGNGKEGIDFLNTHSAPSLILLDFMMPVMNGWEFRVAQMADPILSKIPVIVMSADNRVQQKAVDFGATGFLKKPIELEDLLVMIRDVCLT